MKQKGLIFNLLSIPVDIIAWIGAYLLAYYLRSQIDPLPVSYVWPFSDYLQFVITLVPFIFATMTLEGLYNFRYPKRGFGQFSSIFISATAGVMYVVLWVFFTRNFFFSRLLIIYAWILSIVFIIVGRWLLDISKKILYRYKIGLRRVIILGPRNNALSLALPLNINPIYGFKVVGIISNDIINDEAVDYLGRYENIDDILDHHKVDDIFVSDPDLNQDRTLALSEKARDKKISFHLTPSALQVGSRKFATSTIAGLPIIEILETPLEGWANIVKRILDLIGSLLFIIFFSWLYIIVAIAVKLTSKGPIIYKDKRVGMAGVFNLYKFRTFKEEYCTGREYGGEEAEVLEDKIISEKNTRTGPIPKIKDDPRVTSIGNFLRKTSLDELPQFFNAFLGDMSIVGPRPHRPKEVAKYKTKHKKLFVVKPGITGLAQISGRSDLDFDEEANIDIYYIENWSIWLDAQIGLQTIAAVLKTRGAY